MIIPLSFHTHTHCLSFGLSPSAAVRHSLCCSLLLMCCSLSLECLCADRYHLFLSFHTLTHFLGIRLLPCAGARHSVLQYVANLLQSFARVRHSNMPFHTPQKTSQSTLYFFLIKTFFLGTLHLDESSLC